MVEIYVMGRQCGRSFLAASTSDPHIFPVHITKQPFQFQTLQPLLRTYLMPRRAQATVGRLQTGAIVRCGAQGVCMEEQHLPRGVVGGAIRVVFNG